MQLLRKEYRVTLGSSLLFLFLHVASINLIWVTATFLTALVPKFGVKQDYVKCRISHFYQPPALRMRIFCTVCSSHLPGTKILVCLESEQTCQSPAAVAFSREQNPLCPNAFLKEMLSCEQWQPQIQGCRERRGKTELHLLPAAHSLLSRVSCGKMAIQTLLAPFPTSVLLRSPQPFLQYLQGAEASAQTPLSVFGGVGSAGKEWEGRQRLFWGAELPQPAEHRWKTQTHLDCPLDH